MPIRHRAPARSLAALVLLAAAPAIAQDCEIPLLNIHGVRPVDSVMHGDFAYIACWNGLQVMALTGDEAMHQVELISLDPVRQVARAGDTLVVLSVDDHLTLHLFDVSEPAATKRLASLDLGPATTEFVTLDMSEGLALVCGSRQIFIVEASDPAAPTLESIVDIAPFDVESHGVLAGDTAIVFGAQLRPRRPVKSSSARIHRLAKRRSSRRGRRRGLHGRQPNAVGDERG